MLRAPLHLFSFFGRATRREYWLTMVPVNAVIVGGARLLVYIDDRTLLESATVLVVLTAVEMNLALGVRRLHDRGRSGWWLVPLYGVPFAGIMWRDWALATLGPSVNPFNNLLILFVLAWGLIELGIRPSEPGQNRYGGGKSAEQVAATFT